MDNLTICNRCGSDACYVQEVNNEINNYMCYGCGFLTNSLMKQGEQFFEEQMLTLPDLYKELMGEDENGLIWMPNMVNVPNKGMVFANGTSAANWKWSGVKAVPMPEEEKVKFAEKGKDYEFKMDMETIQHFDERDFIEALDYIGVFENQD